MGCPHGRGSASKAVENDGQLAADLSFVQSNTETLLRALLPTATPASVTVATGSGGKGKAKARVRGRDHRRSENVGGGGGGGRAARSTLPVDTVMAYAFPRAMDSGAGRLREWVELMDSVLTTRYA